MVPLEIKERGDSRTEEIEKTIAHLKPDAKSENLYHTVADFHAAFISGKTSPLDVSKSLLQLIASSSEHAKAFLEIKRPTILAAAEESSGRYQAGRPLGILDGVPVGVKDEGMYILELLSPHSQSLPIPSSFCTSERELLPRTIDLNAHKSARGVS